MTNKTSERSEKNRVLIFDTTLRDGEQWPGASMTFEEKLEVAELWTKWASISSRPVSRSPAKAISSRCPRSPNGPRRRSSPALRGRR